MQPGGELGAMWHSPGVDDSPSAFQQQDEGIWADLLALPFRALVKQPPVSYMSRMIFLFLLALLAPAAALGPARVNLGTAGNFVLLAKTGISTVPESSIVGDTGVSPAPAIYYTGFNLAYTNGTTYATSAQVIGKMYAADMGDPTPSTLTNFFPGLYNWDSDVRVTTDSTVSGSATDTWIFQIPGQLIVSNGVQLTLAGGALASNIVWVVSDSVTFGTSSVWEEVVLGQTVIHLLTGASTTGLLLAQSAVTFQSSSVVYSAPVASRKRAARGAPARL